MSQVGANPSPQAQTQPQAQPIPAAPPSRSEVERKLSFRSTPRSVTSSTGDSPKKGRKGTGNYLGNPMAYPTSGNDSDTSSIASSYTPMAVPASPSLPSTPGGGITSLTQKKGTAIGIGPGIAELDEDVEEEEEEIEGEGDGSGSDDEAENAQVQGDLARGMEGERVLKGGYLWKKQERRKAWKKRWFVLRTGKLAYYKDDREYSLKKVIDLKSVHTVAPVTVKKHSFSFGIVTSKRTFLVKASSPDEMEDWVRAINAARRKLSEREEEERNKREGKIGPSSSSAAVPIPARIGGETIDTTHQGTYSSVFSGTTSTSFSASPVATTGYFAPRVSTASQGYSQGPVSPSIGVPPASPMDTTNTLSSQMAKMNMPRTPSGSFPTQGPPPAQGSSRTGARRERSASSFSSSAGDQQPQQNLSQPLPISSDEDEAYFSDPNAAFGTLGLNQTQPGQENPEVQPQYMQQVVDPKKVILQGYLMKRSKGRGRKVWKKRWFYLTSQGLTYTKSHMDSRALRYIPLTSVLDALEIDSDDPSLPSDEDSDDGPSMPNMSRQLSTLRAQRKDTKAFGNDAGSSTGMGTEEHTFRIVTAKRVFVLCAPSEEDEIKWLAAFRALLNRGRERNNTVTTNPNAGPMSPVEVDQERRGSNFIQPQSIQLPPPPQPLPQQQQVPLIVSQPPTPATMPPLGEALPTPSATTSQGPPIWDRGGDNASSGSGSGEMYGNGVIAAPGAAATYGGRGRSATYTAQKAVADAVKRYRPEGQGQGQSQPAQG